VSMRQRIAWFYFSDVGEHRLQYSTRGLAGHTATDAEREEQQRATFARHETATALNMRRLYPLVVTLRKVLLIVIPFVFKDALYQTTFALLALISVLLLHSSLSSFARDLWRNALNRVETTSTVRLTAHATQRGTASAHASKDSLLIRFIHFVFVCLCLSCVCVCTLIV